MITKALGIFDIMVGLFFLLFYFLDFISSGFIVTLGIILLIKGVLFGLSIDFASIGDGISAIIILLSTSMDIPRMMAIVISLFLFQKGLMGLISSE